MFKGNILLLFLFVAINSEIQDLFRKFAQFSFFQNKSIKIKDK